MCFIKRILESNQSCMMVYCYDWKPVWNLSSIKSRTQTNGRNWKDRDFSGMQGQTFWCLKLCKNLMEE